MTATEQQIIYRTFLSRLDHFKNERLIKILKRGVTKKFAFNRVNLDLQCNSLNQFAEKLFFYGEKSKYFWEQKLGREFSINDIGQDIFKYIFQKFKEISEKEDCNQVTRTYLKKNKKAFNYFKDAQNIKAEFKRIMQPHCNPNLLIV